MRDDLNNAAIALWRAHGGPVGTIGTKPLLAGRNGRVVRLASSDESIAVVAKAYFSDGQRDRLGSEWAFLDHAERLGIHNVPRAIARDLDANIGLYQFIPGRKLAPGEVGEREVLAAAAFVRALNTSPSGALLPEASESGFSIADHLNHVNRRFNRLIALTPESDIEFEAKALVSEMSEWWNELKQRIVKHGMAQGYTLNAIIPAHERVISPSDFGFHNAIVRSDGEIVFLDFEYAGWDDVAKLAADFFFQPEIPVPFGLFDCFLEALLDGRPDAIRTRERILLLRPAFGIKWCCILLNVFIPGFARRGSFADPDFASPRHKCEQLQKANHAFRTLRDKPWPI